MRNHQVTSWEGAGYPGVPSAYNQEEGKTFLGVGGMVRTIYSQVGWDIGSASCQESFCWTDDCNKAFRKLKGAMWESAILSRHDFTKPFTLQTDASWVGLGATLLQEVRERRPAAFLASCSPEKPHIWPLKKNVLQWNGLWKNWNTICLEETLFRRVITEHYGGC